MIARLLGLLTASALVGCITKADLAARLRQSAVADHLPEVVACWESTFEASGFRGEYFAIVDFTLRRDGSIAGAVVRELRDAASGGDEPAGDPDFTDCLTRALDGSSLAGAGLEPGRDVKIFGYR